MIEREHGIRPAGTGGDNRPPGDQLSAGIYRELHALARHCLAREHGPCTLSPATLVHEAYLRLNGGVAPAAADRRHFFALAAIAMRRILVDHARAKRAGKRIPVQYLCTYYDDQHRLEEHSLAAEQLLHLDQALERLGGIDPQMVKVVELRYFAGLGVDATAAALECSPRTVNRLWTAARAWLARELG